MKIIENRSYSDMLAFDTFEERFNYLKLDGLIGEETFGFDRYLNQIFYRSREWKRVRDSVILRDQGCDLGILDREIYGKIVVHHINPLLKDNIKNRDLDVLLNPEFLISTSINTHNAIHYGDDSLLIKDPIIRKPNDTSPWRS